MQVLPTLALGCLLLPPTAAPAQQGERYTLDGDDVAIYNLAGSLAVKPGTGAVSVDVVRGGADAAKPRVERGELDGRETLRIVYPAESIVYSGIERGSSTTLKVRDDGTFSDGEKAGSAWTPARGRSKSRDSAAASFPLIPDPAG